MAGTIGERVALARERAGLSQSKLGRSIGLSPQAIQQLEAGDSHGSKHLLAIARVLKVSADWLETGEGAIDSLPSVKNNLVDISGAEYAHLAVYDIRFAAGAGSINESESPIDHYLMSMNLLRSMTRAPLTQIGVFQVSGDSMEPTIYNRDWVFVDCTQTRLVNPGIYCLNVEGLALVKRASQHLETGVVTLVSDNLKYPRQTIKRPDRLRVVGRVFLSIRRH